MYTPDQIEILRSRWLTTEGLKVRDEVLAELIADGEAWPESLEKLMPPSCPPAPHSEVLTDIRGIDLSGLNLSKARLSFVDASYARFTGCILQGTSFQGSLLDNVDFQGSDLDKADLLQIVATDANFNHCLMRNVVMMTSHLKRCSFQGADLTEGRVDGSKFFNCDFAGAKIEYGSAICTVVSTHKKRA